MESYTIVFFYFFWNRGLIQVSNMLGRHSATKLHHNSLLCDGGLLNCSGCPWTCDPLTWDYRCVLSSVFVFWCLISLNIMSSRFCCAILFFVFRISFFKAEEYSTVYTYYVLWIFLCFFIYFFQFYLPMDTWAFILSAHGYLSISLCTIVF